MEQNGPHYAPDSLSGTWLQTERKEWATSGMTFGNGLQWRKKLIWNNSQGGIEDQERQKQLKRKNEGPGETDKENDRLLRAPQAADRGQLRTAVRLLRGFKLLPPTEATADAIEQLYQTGGEAQKRTDDAFEETTHWLKSDVRQQHVLSHIRNAKRQAHLGPSGERNSHISALLVSPRGLQVLTHPAFTEPVLQAKVTVGDKGGGKARPVAFEEMLLKMVTSSILRAHFSQILRAAGRKYSLHVTSRMGSEQ